MRELRMYGGHAGCLSTPPPALSRAARAPVAALTPLKGLRPEVLVLAGCDKLADLAPLKGMKTLKALVLTDTRFAKSSLRDVVGE